MASGSYGSSKSTSSVSSSSSGGCCTPATVSIDYWIWDFVVGDQVLVTQQATRGTFNECEYYVYWVDPNCWKAKYHPHDPELWAVKLYLSYNSTTGCWDMQIDDFCNANNWLWHLCNNDPCNPIGTYTIGFGTMPVNQPIVT